MGTVNRAVSVQGGLLDLFAPKFGLDSLGAPGETIILKVVIELRNQGRLVLFASYPINGRHVQIRTKKLIELGPEVSVVSVSRYSKKTFIAEANDALSRQSLQDLRAWFQMASSFHSALKGSSPPRTLTACTPLRRRFSRS